MVYSIKQTKSLTEKHIMTTQTASTSTANFIVWNKSIMTRRGFLPADLSIAVGSTKLQDIWLNLRKRTIAEVANEVKTLWIAAVAVEKGINIAAAAEQVEAFIARHDNPANWVDVAADGSWSMPFEQAIAVAEVAVETVAIVKVETRTEEEIKSAKKVKRILAADPLNLQIFWYIVQNQPIGSVGFCNTAGIKTQTMQARARAIQSAVKGSLKNETIASHLMRIMGVQITTAGGWLKAR